MKAAKVKKDVWRFPHLQVSAGHDGVAEIAGAQRGPLEAGQTEVDPVHLAVVENGAFQVGTLGREGGRLIICRREGELNYIQCI